MVDKRSLKVASSSFPLVGMSRLWLKARKRCLKNDLFDVEDASASGTLSILIMAFVFGDSMTTTRDNENKVG